MYPLFFDPTYILLIPALIFAIWAQFKVKSTFNKFSQISTRRNVTGKQIAEYILSQFGVYDVNVEPIRGELTDHYDPKEKVVRLSEPVYNSTSIAAIGVAAHECGHAIQHKVGYVPIKLRNAIVPVVNFTSWMAFPLFFIGFFFRGKMLMDLGILFFLGVVIFHAITLPVELNASWRALKILQTSQYLIGDEIKGAKKVLTAAAMTYIAATAMAIMQLVRLLILRDSRD